MIKFFFSQGLGRFYLVALIILVAGLIALLKYHQTPEKPVPLYWVSSMDPNYRSDKPGKCPHGMDLVPVYAQTASTQNNAGIISINPGVQNQLSVRKAKVVWGVLNQQLRAFGRVVADPALMVQINPRTAGWVDMLFVHSEGESVKRGQPLFSFSSPELIAAQEQYLAARKQGEAQALRAHSQLKALMMDDWAIEILKTQGVAQRSTVFHAPKDGVVDMLKIRENAYVAPGQMVMAVGSMERVWVWLEVFASQGALIAANQLASLTSSALPGLVWQAQIDSIAPDLDAKNRTLRVRASLPNANMQLRANMLMEGMITLPARKPALLVNRQAVIQTDEHNRVVLDIGDGRFKSVNVVLGQSNSELVEVLEGLQEGDIIVTSAQFLIDAESSKSSDFNRLTSAQELSKLKPTWVQAEVTELFPGQRKIQLSHAAVTEWDMPAMTMNFAVAPGVNIDNIKLADQLRVKIADGDPLFNILEIQPLPAGQAP